MSRIIDPTNTADDTAYSGINDLASITSDKAAIDNSPLFQLAEAFIVDLLPDTELRSPPVAEKGRTYPKRASVITALQFLAASYLMRAGGSVGSSSSSGDTTIERTGTLRSETEQIGPVSRTKNYSTSETSTESHRVQTEVTHESRAEWMENQAHIILEQLGAKVQALDMGDLVVLTDSKLDEDLRQTEEESQVIGDLSYIRR